MADRIDLLRLYASSDNTQWNEFLTNCKRRGDISKLMQILRACQEGMAHLAKQKLNDEKLNVWFARLVRSIEKTMTSIVREKAPNPFDVGIGSAEMKHQKKKRDQELRNFIKKNSY